MCVKNLCLCERIRVCERICVCNRICVFARMRVSKKKNARVEEYDIRSKLLDMSWSILQD